MKKVKYLLATLIIGGLLVTGCKKTEPTPTPTPTPEKIEYKILNTDGNHTISPCFKLDVTYLDANGQSVTETNITLPWSKTFEVNFPFHAKMEGTFSYDEAELPEEIVLGCSRGIGAYTNGTLHIEMNDKYSTFHSKEKFLNTIAEHPELLKFTEKKDF